MLIIVAELLTTCSMIPECGGTDAGAARLVHQLFSLSNDSHLFDGVGCPVDHIAYCPSVLVH